MHPLPHRGGYEESGASSRSSGFSSEADPATTPHRSACWIIGATSGIGAAATRRLASSERHLVLSGRRTDLLTQMVDQVRGQGGSAKALPVDVSDRAAFSAAVDAFPGGIESVSELVFCAGHNVARRFWQDLDLAEFDRVVSTNFNAVAWCIARLLPGMVAAGYGRFVIVSSWAGWAHARGAGVAYSASKTALKPLTESVNEQHGPDGVSACLLCPGDVDTPLIDRRPVVPSDEQREQMLAADDVARTVRFVLDLPRHIAVNELVMSPVRSHAYGR